MDIKSIVELKPRPEMPQFGPGDTVKVSLKVVEGDRERTQVFQGVVIGVRKGGASSSFTVRRVSYGVGVERTIFFQSPRLEKVEVVRRGKVRRAKLFYLRGLSSREGRIKEKTREISARLGVGVPDEAPPVPTEPTTEAPSAPKGPPAPA